MQLKNKKYTLFFVLAILAVIALAAPAAALQLPLTVHNLDTGEDFSTIQAAIDATNTTAGHTIQVDGRTPYYEGVDVTKAVILQGKDTGDGLPVIRTSGNPAIVLQANGAEIHEFNVQAEYEGGIQVRSDDNWIDAVTIDVTGFYSGIYIDESDGNTITDCTVYNGGYALELFEAAGNEITNCTFNGAFTGIFLDGYYSLQTHDNVITGCTVNNGVYSLRSLYSSGNTITDCLFIGAQTDGINLGSSNNNVFTRCTVRDTLGQEMVNCGVDADDSTGNWFEDCTVTGNANHGFYFTECDGTTLRGCIVNDNDYGIHFQYSDNIQVKDCTVTGNSNAGIILLENGNNVVVANNFLKNTQNVDLSQNTNPNIDWNTAKTAGTSIVYGPYLGGNFWATPDGDGWSETQPDADGDGIIDEPYVMEVTVVETTYTYTDELPLAYVMTAAFSADPTSGTAPLSVQFSDASVGEPTSWAWDFGDGATSSVANPLHRYSSAGVYTVTLTASNAFADDSETRTGYISVGAPDNGGDGGPSETAASVSRGLSGGDNTTFNLDPSKSAFYAIEVTVNGTVKEILVTARDIGSPESSIPALNGTVFQFIEVTLYKTTDDVISSAEIQFSIPIEWFEEQGIDFSDIVLYRWHDGEWEELPTMFVKEEDGKAYFTATSPGFSLFAIIAAKEQVVAGEGEEIPVPTEEPTVEATVTEEPAPGEPLPPETAAPTPEPTQSPLLWAPVAALGALLLMGKRW